MTYKISPLLAATLVALAAGMPVAHAESAKGPDADDAAKAVRVAPPEGYTPWLAHQFRDGLARVAYVHKTTHLEGLLDRKGKWVVEPTEAVSASCDEGLLQVRREGRWQLLDCQGEAVAKLPWADVWRASGGLMAVRAPAEGDKPAAWGFIDGTGKLAIPPRFEWVSTFEHGVAGARRAGRYGLIDLAGREVMPFVHDYVGPIGEGLVRVKDGDAIWIADAKGRRAFPGEFAEFERYQEGYAVATYKGEPFDANVLVDRRGKPAAPQRKRLWHGVSGGLIGFKEGAKFGFQRPDGKVAIPARFDGVWQFGDGLAAVRLGDRWGFIDPKGQVVIPPRFDAVSFFSEGLAAVREGSHAGFIDRTGAFRIDLGPSPTFYSL